MTPFFNELFGELRSLLNNKDSSLQARIPVVLYRKNIPHTQENVLQMREVVSYLAGCGLKINFEVVKSLLEIFDWQYGEPLPENNPYVALFDLVQDTRADMYRSAK